MLTTLAIIATIYGTIAMFTLTRCRHERLTDRVALSLLTPIVLAWVAVEWAWSRVEGLG